MAREEINDVSEIDLIFETNDRLDALVELLVEKKVFSENEYLKKVAEIAERNENI